MIAHSAANGAAEAPALAPTAGEFALREVFPAIPASFVLTELPGLGLRASNALRREGLRTFGDVATWRVTDLRRLRNVGDRTADQLLLGLRAVDDEAAARTTADAAPVRPEDSEQELQQAWAVTRALLNVSRWAATYVSPDLMMLGALAAAGEASGLPDEVQSALVLLQGVRVADLDRAARAVRPGDALAAWARGLGARDRLIVERRLLAASPRSLDQLARELRVSKERVRQLEERVRRSAHELFGAEWMPLAGSLDALRALTAPLRRFDPRTPVGLDLDRVWPALTCGEAEVLARLSGDATLSDGFVGWPSVQHWTEVTRAAVGEISPGRPADLGPARAALVEQGVDPDEVEPWLAALGYVVVGDSVMVTPRGLADRAVVELTREGVPLTTDDLQARLGHERHVDTVRRALRTDERVVRAGPHSWALAEWGGPVFHGVRPAMEDALREGGGELTVDELAARLEHFGVSASTVRLYALKEPFQTVRGVVTLR